MSKVFNMDADVTLGSEELPDWRKEDIPETEDDDEELEETPADVIAILGFDPKKEFSQSSREAMIATDVARSISDLR